MNGEEAARLLRERAESYGRDGSTFRHHSDTQNAVMYETIARELRAVANEIA